MAASRCRKYSVNVIKTEQVTHRHDNQTKTKDVTTSLCHIISRPFRGIRQAWKDHQSGRKIRKRTTQEQGTQTEQREAEEETKKPQNPPEIPVPATEELPPGNKRPGDRPRARQHSSVVEHWVHQEGEWPWRIEQLVHQDSSGNARGIWVLEVKDLSAMYWERKDRPGKRIPATVPQAHWPFPRQGKRENDSNGPSIEEPDELMQWLWR